VRGGVTTQASDPSPRTAGPGADGVLPAAARDWLREGRRMVVASLVSIEGSAPLEPGASMAVDADGRIEGSVTGGCVEAALFEEAQEVLAGGPPRLLTYGISDSEAAGVGLMCGGTVHVLVAEVDAGSREALLRAAAAVEAGEPAAVATLLDGPAAGSRLAIVPDGAAGTLRGGGLLDHAVERDARGLLAQGVSTVRRYGAGGEEMGSELRVQVRAFASPPAMVIFGAIDFSVAVARFARELGYEVTICDARAAFAGSSRFSAVADVVVEWPDRFLEGRTLTDRDVVLVFTHDPKFDEPALTGALRSGAGYVGALGSRRTHAQRVARLREAGVPAQDIGRIAAPAGLDIGARTPPETAVSVLAEIIAHRSGRRGVPLSETAGPIHASAEGA
jgi:xanthine dehydrogenase accessory factor